MQVAAQRQVIVFTHDLVFLKILIDESERQQVVINHQYVRREPQAGLVSPDLPWRAMGVRQRLGVLKSRLQAATALFNKGQLSDYEAAGKEIFGALREAWEGAITEVLLNGAVEPYRPDIQTTRVLKLHDITETDLKAMEEGMTVCSRWFLGHTEAAADGTPFPEPEELKGRIEDLEGWTSAIRKRRN